jgi:hypothetical protein
MLQIAEADVLLVATEVCKADEDWVDDVDEAFVAASMLDVGPAGFAYRGHVKAVAVLDKRFLRRTESASGGRGLFHTLILAAAAVIQLILFDAWGEGEFLKAATHGILDPGRWTRCLGLDYRTALEDSGLPAADELPGD